MKLFRIPMSSTAAWFDQQISLTGQLYTLEFYFNVRGMMWMMNIGDASENYIVTQVPLLINRNLTGGYSDARLPSGYFCCFDMTGNDQEPSLSSFTTTHKLFFVEN